MTYKLLDIGKGYPSAIKTAQNVLYYWERGERVETLYQEILRELAAYLSTKYTPGTAAERAGTIEAGINYSLREKGMPCPPLAERDEMLVDLFGDVMETQIAEEKRQAERDARLLEEEGMIPLDVIIEATRVLRGDND